LDVGEAILGSLFGRRESFFIARMELGRANIHILAKFKSLSFLDRLSSVLSEWLKNWAQTLADNCKAKRLMGLWTDGPMESGLSFRPSLW